jgi:opacity protein-like surface antigen
MAKRYLDCNIKNSGFSPYVMAGIGLANASWNTPDGTTDDSVFAWQAGAGIGFKASDKVTVDLGYRYFTTRDLNFYGFLYSAASSNILAGIRIDI